MLTARREFFRDLEISGLLAEKTLIAKHFGAGKAKSNILRRIKNQPCRFAMLSLEIGADERVFMTEWVEKAYSGPKCMLGLFIRFL